MYLEGGKKTTSLTRQLLAFSRDQVLETKLISLNDLVKNMAKMLNRIIGEDIELELNVNTPVRTILADPGQIEQILMNLTVNARDAMPVGGNLTIETAAVDLGEENLNIRGIFNPAHIQCWQYQTLVQA